LLQAEKSFPFVLDLMPNQTSNVAGIALQRKNKRFEKRKGLRCGRADQVTMKTYDAIADTFEEDVGQASSAPAFAQ